MGKTLSMLRRTLCSVALLGLLATAGCSSGSGDSASKKPTTTLFGQTTSTSVKVPKGFTGGDVKAFCAAFDEVVKVSAVAFEKSRDAASIRAEYTKVGEAGRRMQAAAPREVKAAVDEAVRINDKVVASGSVDAFKGDANQRNGAVIAQYAAANCK
jgi:hypothetical protein